MLGQTQELPVVGDFNQRAIPGCVYHPQATSMDVFTLVTFPDSICRAKTDIINELDPERIAAEAKKVARKYELAERDRTNGWSRFERVTMLDVSALDKFERSSNGATKRSARNGTTTPSQKITTIYVILLHHIPNAKAWSEGGQDGPIPCFKTNGDLLETIHGEELCKRASYKPPVIRQKWTGEIPMCGFRKNEDGRSVARVIRGEQDVGQMYLTLARRSERNQHQNPTQNGTEST
jgi:hypothetical protein